MNFTRDMINTHPQGIAEPKKDSLIDAIQACFDNAQACTTCSDACLGERDIEMLRSTIRSTSDCADLCSATGKILSRLNDPRWDVLRAVTRACITEVKSCEMECKEHASKHEHCRICADSCRTCGNMLSEYLKYIDTK